LSGGPIIVTALFGRGDEGWLEDLRRAHYPPEHNRVPAHLTLFRHLPPGLGAELATRLKAIAAAPPPRAEVAGILDLGEGTALRVESPGLEAIRAELAEAFHGLLMPQDQAGWRPHVTIQNKVARREARALQARMKPGFARRPLAIAGLATWRYREDGRWEPLKAHRFRG
jgi:hypothetical protein